MTAVSEMREEDLELERRRIRKEHDHHGEMKDMLEKLNHARGLRRRGKEIEEELKRRRRKG